LYIIGWWNELFKIWSDKNIERINILLLIGANWLITFSVIYLGWNFKLQLCRGQKFLFKTFWINNFRCVFKKLCDLAICVWAKPARGDERGGRAACGSRSALKAAAHSRIVTWLSATLSSSFFTYWSILNYVLILWKMPLTQNMLVLTEIYQLE
jgi:hypothetical protein